MRTVHGIALAGVGLVGLVGLVGCGKTDECTHLEKLLAQHEKVLVDATARANAREKLKARADKSEQTMQKLLDASGIEQSEEAITAELLARVAKVPTATVVHDLAQLGTTQEGDTITTAEWRIRFQEKDPAKAWDRVVSLSAVPPLMMLTTVMREKGKDEWRVTMQRPLPVRSPYQPAPVPLAMPDDPQVVPAQTGFCGAAELRKKIEDTRVKIGAVRSDAEATSLLLASAPTFEGIRRRADGVIRTERDAREIMTKTMEGVIKQKLPFKAIGYEDPSVIVELWGGPKELKALETLLLPYADRVKATDMTPPGVVRRAVVVKQSKKAGPEESGLDEHGHF